MCDPPQKLTDHKYKNKTNQRIININHLAHQKALAEKNNMPSTVLGVRIHWSPFLFPAQTHTPQCFLPPSNTRSILQCNLAENPRLLDKQDGQDNSILGFQGKKVQDKGQKTLLIYRKVSVPNLIYFTTQSQIIKPANSLKNYLNSTVQSPQQKGLEQLESKIPYDYFQKWTNQSQKTQLCTFLCKE